VFLDLAEGVAGKVFDDSDFAWALVVGERSSAKGGELLEKRVRRRGEGGRLDDGGGPDERPGRSASRAAAKNESAVHASPFGQARHQGQNKNRGLRRRQTAQLTNSGRSWQRLRPHPGPLPEGEGKAPVAAREVSRRHGGRRRAARERSVSEGAGGRSRPFGRAVRRCARRAQIPRKRGATVERATGFKPATSSASRHYRRSFKPPVNPSRAPPSRSAGFPPVPADRTSFDLVPRRLWSRASTLMTSNEKHRE
jgi:hypothetical protein